MLEIVDDSHESQLRGFFQYIFENEAGFVYVAHKIPGNQRAFQQAFFHWPDQQSELIRHIIVHRDHHEVYYAPALFSAPSALKEHVVGSRVFWCEFDGNTPDTDWFTGVHTGRLPTPSLRVQSSEAGHEHWYWKLDKLTDTVGLERVNRAITYLLEADSSGWDANQILRPILTFNHKRAKPVLALQWEAGYYTQQEFIELPQPPPVQTIPTPERIPGTQEVIFRYKFSDEVQDLFINGAPVGARSEAEMKLGYYLAEMNMTNEEMLSVLHNADERWGKFSGRQDQMVRLMEIITIARQKYPFKPSAEHVGSPFLQPMGWLTLIRSEVHIEWIWDTWLQKAGYMLLTGPSQVGKTQLSLDVCTSMALGQPALDRQTKQAKIGFFSLEMSQPELKEFLLLQQMGLTQSEQDMLEQNLLFFPLGEPLYLSRSEVREQVEQIIGDLQLDGCVFDSMGSVTSTSLSEEVAVKNLIDWNDRLRQRTGAFTWYIHHHRKANGDNKRPNRLSDVYGNQYITARATTVLCLWESGIANNIEFLPLKVRLRANPGKFLIQRGANLRYTRIVDGLVTQQPDNVGEDQLTSITIVENTSQSNRLTEGL